MITPIVKWAGGKSKIEKEFKELYDKVKPELYIDIFSGSLTLPLILLPKKAIFNDINLSLINCYKVIKKYPDLLITNLKIYNHKDYNTKEKFNIIRDKFNILKHKENLDKKDKIELATLFLYLNKRSFNGLYRENSSGLYNVPYREYNSNIFNEDNILELSNYLNKNDIVLTNKNIFHIDIIETIKSYNISFDKILVYLDPPYYPSKKSKFTGYSKFPFNVDEQVKLKKICDILHKNKIKFIMSNSPCLEIKDLYKDYHQKCLYIGRQMRSGKGKSKVFSDNNENNEILIYNI
jgi:DNA adenine methylase